jgi:DNA-binding transcriptional LysR family regulator
MTRTLLAVPLLLVAACNPTASEIESTLAARGIAPKQASCVARELDGRLAERDWRLLAELAGDTMRDKDEWRDMTLGEMQDKLARISDSRVVATLLRAGIGCAVLEGLDAPRRATL